MSGNDGNISEELICLGVLHKAESTGAMITSMALHIVFAISTTLENILVLVTIWGTSNLRCSPSNILLCGLVLSDLCVGLISEPCFIALQILILKNKLTSCVLPSVNAIICSFLKEVSLFTVTAVSIDRYLAIYFHLRYAEVVTEKKAQIALVCLWLISGVDSIVWNSGFATFSHVMVAVSTVCLVAVLFTWIKIYQVMRRHQAQIHEQFNTERHQFDMSRFKKSVTNTMLILMIFLVCYLPYVIFSIIFAFNLYPTTFKFVTFFYFFTVLNSLLNPLLYCWRYCGIRTAAKQTLIKLFCQTEVQ